MILIEEIVDLLSSKNPSLENALFKAKVLAHQLGEVELKRWIDSELVGYTEDSSLPSYRVIEITIVGNASNGAYSYQNQPLPVYHLDKQLRGRLQTSRLTQSVSVIEMWVEKEKNLSIVIPPELYPRISEGLGNGYMVERAWGKHSDGSMLQVVTEVRSRLLDFVLNLSDKIPNEVSANDIRKISKEIGVGEIFRSAVFGNNTTIVVGSGSVSNITNSVGLNDFEALMSDLRCQAVPDVDINALKNAIDIDQGAEDHEQKRLGPNVRKWIGDMMAKAGSSAWDVSFATASSVLIKAISAYYGFGS